MPDHPLIWHREGRLPTIIGHPRLDVCAIRSWWVNAGMSAYAVSQWSGLTQEEVQAAVVYWAEHHAELTALQARIDAEWEIKDAARRTRREVREAAQAEAARYVKPGKVERR